jgi:hypothetical protein
VEGSAVLRGPAKFQVMPDETLMLRPDRPKRLRKLGHQLPFAFLGVALILLSYNLRYGVEVEWEIVLVILFVLLVGASYFSVNWNATLFVHGTTFGQTTAARWKRTFDINTVTGVDKLTIRRGNQPAAAQFLVLGPNGVVLMKIRDDTWSTDDLNHLWGRLHVVPAGTFDRMVNYREFKRMYGDR